MVLALRSNYAACTALLWLILSALAAPSPAAAQDPASISAALQGAASLPLSQSFRVSLFLLNATGLLTKLPSLAPLTLFAPTDAAWHAAFKALAMPYVGSYMPVYGGGMGGDGMGGDGMGGDGMGGDGMGGGVMGGGGGISPGSPGTPVSSPGQPMPRAAAGGESASVAMVPGGGVSVGLPPVDVPLPGGTNVVSLPGVDVNVSTPDIPGVDLNGTFPGMPGGPDGWNTTMPPEFNFTMPDPLDFDPLLAALSAVFAGNCSPGSWETLAASRPEAVKAVNEILTYHVATAALNAAAIQAQFTDAAGNLTTVNGQPLWVDYNTTESAAELSPYSPQQRSLIEQGVGVDPEGNAYYPNGTVIAANGTVIFDGVSAIGVDSDGNVYYPNGTVADANGTVITNGTAIDGGGIFLPPSNDTSSANGTVTPPGVVTAQIDPPLPAQLGAPTTLPQVNPPVMGGTGGEGMGVPGGGVGMGGGASEGMGPGNMGDMGGMGGIGGMGGMGGMGENYTEWWAGMEAWMEQAIPGMNVSMDEYMNWFNGSYYGMSANCSMWQQPGSSMNVAKVVSPDLMDAAGIVVHGIDGVLIPLTRVLPAFAKGGVPTPIAMPVADGNGGAAGGTSGTPSSSEGATNATSSVSSADSGAKSVTSGTPAAPPSGSGNKAGAAAAAGSTALLSLVFAVAFSLVAVV